MELKLLLLSFDWDNLYGDMWYAYILTVDKKRTKNMLRSLREENKYHEIISVVDAAGHHD